ncbi:MAG: 16S rRNA (cytidine(1402)-2'-O)-methyltransferase [Rhodothermia bacterium]|nr:16S rRNA (cytidine(1402)-2'-O)-methyltransferase [Rhodothermia bacterium]
MLYVVPTPIGNLGDMTFRAVDVLRDVAVIACEDTRTSSKLLRHYGIDTPTISYHEHNERSRTPKLVNRMSAGEKVALISDAGMPGVSDPGFYLVRECVREGIDVVVLPGASAVVAAVVGSALPCDRFVYEGFLPAKKGRNARLESLKSETRSIVLFESPHRIKRTLRDLLATFGPERRVAIAREISKVHEEYIRGSIAEVAEHFEALDKPKGELVVVIEGLRQ